MERRAPNVLTLPPFSVRAAVSSIDEQNRTVEIILSTGAAVERYDWMHDKRYLEVLSLDPEHVDVARLNAGAALLDSHDYESVRSQLGAIVPGSVQIAKGEMRARARFSRRDDVEGVWQDVRDGLVNSISIGYRVYQYEEKEGKANALPVRTATRWEVYEASMVSVPADAGAKVRDGQSADGNTCEIVPAGAETRAAAEPAQKIQAAVPAAVSKETTMDPNQRAESFVADMSLPPAPTAAAVTAPEPTAEERAILAERERNQGIEQACAVARMPAAFTRKLIADGVALVEAQRQVFRKMAERGENDVPSVNSRVEVTGEDPMVHTRAGIVEALCHKAHPEREIEERGGQKRTVGFKLTEKARPYMGLSLLRIAERLLESRNVRTATMNGEEIASLALRSGMHTTSDFPLILADVANKTLRAGYDEAPQTFGPITRRVTVPDFKDVKRTQIGEAPTLQEVNEHGEITSGTIAEGREVYHVKTYGKIFSITRKAIVNDDLAAFSRVPMMMGRQARNLESDLVWAELTANAAMGDGDNLFSDNHANWDNVGAFISVASIGAGRTAMRTQTGVDRSTLLNVMPRYLIVPAALETLADQFVSQNLLASEAGSVNPFAGRLQVIAEPRLDAASSTQWYLAASIAEFPDIIELAGLEGAAGPRLEQQLGFEIEGVKFKIAYDIGAKVIDFRGLYRNAGEALPT